jgi:monoamine oxidase
MKHSNITRTSLLGTLLRAFRTAVIANRKNQAPVDELVDMQKQHLLTRRRFISQTTMASVALGVGSSMLFSGCPRDKSSLDYSRKITIVGGGAAGLNAAYQLKKAGIGSTIYEASNRTGGRMFTAKNIMGSGLITEIGGEFIDTIHEDMLTMATEFGLELIDVESPSEQALIKETYYFDGQHYTFADMVTAFQSVAAQIQADYDLIPDDITYLAPGAAAPFDNLSLAAYFDQIGMTGYLRKMMDVAYITEYGLEMHQQSSINFLYLFVPELFTNNQQLFGESDERYKIKGGNQLLVDKLAHDVSDQIYTNHKLVAIKKTLNGNRLTFESEGTTFDLDTDFVIMTMPFSVLREVDLSQAELSAVKMQAINELGYGTNAKLMLGFDTRYWRNLGYAGAVLSDNGIQLGWDNSQLQTGTAGGFTVFLGGNDGVNVGLDTPETQAALYLPKIEQIWTGATTQHNNKVSRMHWPSHPFTKGSYACYKPGQWTAFAGAEQQTEGNMLFAGEHCSAAYQGYMNGALETGRVAAENLLAMIG